MSNVTDHPAAQRPFWTLLSLSAVLVGACGGLGTLLIRQLQREWHVKIQGGQAPWEPGPAEFIALFSAAVVFLAGVAFATIGRRRHESRHGLRAVTLAGNAFCLCTFLIVGGCSWIDASRTAKRLAEDMEKQRQRDQKLDEEDRKTVRLRLKQYVRGFGVPDGLNLARKKRATWLGTGMVDSGEGSVSVGAPGDVTPINGPPDVKASVTWPEPRQFELTIAFDNPEATLTLDVENTRDPLTPRWPLLFDLTATCDQKPIDLPLDLPPGKHVIAVKGRCP